MYPQGSGTRPYAVHPPLEPPSIGVEYAGWYGQYASRRVGDGRVANSVVKLVSSFLTIRDELWSFVGNKGNPRWHLACHRSPHRQSLGLCLWVAHRRGLFAAQSVA